MTFIAGHLTHPLHVESPLAFESQLPLQQFEGFLFLDLWNAYGFPKMDCDFFSV
jgi:hypothetical protein